MNWKKQLSCVLASAALMGALALPASAADYTDLGRDHWAYGDMSRAACLHIINGLGAGVMAPDQELTRGQFLVMLARICDGESYAAAVAGGQAWDRAGYDMAVDRGLLTEGDFLPVDAARLAEPITRQEVAVLLDRLLPEEIEYPADFWAEIPPIRESLLDWESMDPHYGSSVERLYELNVIRGNEKKMFSGLDRLRRCDGTVLAMRALELLDFYNSGREKTIQVSFVDQWGQLLYQPMPYETYVNATFYWDAVDQILPRGFTAVEHEALPQTVSAACSDYTVMIRAMTEREILRRETEEKYYRGELTPEEEMAFELHQEGWNPSKSQVLFGVEGESRFHDQAVAQSNMTAVTFPVWRIARDGSKVSGTATINVHKAVAADVVAVFTEIYNDPEQFPIQTVGGYRWGDGGEHGCGTAIDINASQNYMIDDGEVLFPGHWTPGQDPLSIPETGSVVRIFSEYGWSWGGNAWAGTTDPTMGRHDYMHFSYMAE